MYWPDVLLRVQLSPFVFSPATQHQHWPVPNHQQWSDMSGARAIPRGPTFNICLLVGQGNYINIVIRKHRFLANYHFCTLYQTHQKSLGSSPPPFQLPKVIEGGVCSCCFKADIPVQKEKITAATWHQEFSRICHCLWLCMHVPRELGYCFFWTSSIWCSTWKCVIVTRYKVSFNVRHCFRIKCSCNVQHSSVIKCSCNVEDSAEIKCWRQRPCRGFVGLFVAGTWFQMENTIAWDV